MGAIKVFIGYMSLEGQAASTIMSYARILNRYLAPDLDILKSYDALRASQLFRGLRWYKGSSRSVRSIKPFFSLDELLSVLDLPIPNDENRDTTMKFRVLWYLAIVTGNRICHVRGAKGVKIRQDGLEILWGPRKVMVEPPNDAIPYEFAWTRIPPRDVLEYLKKKGIPDIGNPNTIATATNAWLKRMTRSGPETDVRRKLTSSSPRIHLSNVLTALVEKGSLTKIRYELLMDHDIKRGMHTYRRTPSGKEDNLEARPASPVAAIGMIHKKRKREE